MWVSTVGKACDFQKTLRAWVEIDEWQLSGVQIVLNFEGAAVDVLLASVGTGSIGSSKKAPFTRAGLRDSKHDCPPLRLAHFH